MMKTANKLQAVFTEITEIRDHKQRFPGYRVFSNATHDKPHVAVPLHFVFIFFIPGNQRLYRESKLFLMFPQK